MTPTKQKLLARAIDKIRKSGGDATVLNTREAEALLNAMLKIYPMPQQKVEK
jgi:hypothetical protein